MDAAFFSKVRVVVIAFFVFFIYAVIVIRLWAVQVCSGEEIQQKVSRQYVRNIRIPAVRGRIFSSDGVMLAGNLRMRSCFIFRRCGGPESGAGR